MDRRPDFRKSVAVIVGINAYDHGVRPLKTAAGDARRLAQLLKDLHGYDVHLLLDAHATQQRIVGLLTEELPSTVGPDDRVLFYFAGHGVALDGKEGPTGYLLLQDARDGEPESYLRMQVLYDTLSALECRHLLVILDSCFSGAFRWSSTRNIGRVPEVIYQERYDRFILDPAWQAIASASYDQEANDELPLFGVLGARGEEGEHSPFAHALFDALEGAADRAAGGGTGDGVITASELGIFLEERVQPPTLEAGSRMQRQTPSLWPLPKHGKGEFIFLVPGHELNLPPAPPLTYENNPWRGLESYDEAHAPLFFGRDDVIQELRQKVDAHPLTVVLGASGTGKSSVVKAGLVPTLKRDVAQQWHVLPIVRPGAAPMEAIKGAVAELGTERAIEERVAAWCAVHPDARLVLVVDQFEELVTLARAAEACEAVLRLLLRLVEAHPEQLRLILTLRSDFEPQFDRSVLRSRWKEAGYVVPPMTQDEIRAVIERPASARVMYFKPSDLVEALINEVIQTPGGLPLLSFALSEMYVHYIDRRSDDRAIEDKDYEAVGGVVGALRTRADAEFEKLDEAQQKTMRRLMLRMVAVEGGGVARRRVPRSELDYPDPAETARAAEVVRRLTAARLVVEGRGEDGEAYVEPAHDALVRAWDRLLGWIHAEQDRVADLRFQHNLARVAQDWEHTADEKAKAGLLWRDAARGGLLAQLVATEEERLDPGALSNGQRLVRHARALRRTSPASGEGAEPWMNRRELAFARRSIRRRRNIRLGLTALVLLIVAGAVAATGFGVVAQQQRRQAEMERDNALSSTLASRALNLVQSKAYVPALLLAVQAHRTGDGAESRDALIRVGQALPPFLVEPMPGGSYDAPPRTDYLGFSPDNTQLALGTGPRPIQFTVRDLGHKRPPEAWRSDDNDLPDWLRRLSEGGPVPLAYALNSDGTLDATGGELGLLELWSFSAGDTTMVWNDDQTFAHSVDAMAFSPDGTRLAVTGSIDNAQRARVWTITRTEGGLPRRLLPVSSVEDLAVDPHGTRVAFVGEEGIRLLDTGNGTQLWAADTTLGAVTALAFSPDGSRLAFGGAPPGEGPRWDWRGGRVWLLDVPTLGLLPQPLDLDESVGQVAFDGTGQRLLVFDYSGRLLYLWDLDQGAPPSEVEPPWAFEETYTEQQGCTWISEEGHLMRFVDFALQTVNVQTGEMLSSRAFPTVNEATQEACSPDGTIAAVVSSYTDGAKSEIQLLDLHAGEALGEAIPLTGSADHLAWSPDGAILAIASQGAVFLWSVADRAYLGSPLSYRSDIRADFGSDVSYAGYFDSLTDPGQGPRDHVRIAFSADGSQVAASFSGSRGAALVLWNLTPDALVANGCRLVNRNFSAAEWARHMGDRPYACTCPALPPHPSTGLSACP